MGIDKDYVWIIACELVVLARKRFALVCGSLLMTAFYFALIYCLA